MSLDGLQYNWSGYVNGPSNYYFGAEIYSHLSGDIYRVNETRWTGYPAQEYKNARDVNSSNRFFNESSAWYGGSGHDFVWISSSTTLNDIVPIAMFLDGDHNFNVTSSQIINHNSILYDCWRLTDSSGGFGYYEKTSGLLINATFRFMGSNIFHIELINTNHAFPTNDNAPILSQGKVDTYNTNCTHEFEFTVTYSDADNDFPVNINVIVNNTACSMEKAIISENNYTLGVAYRYRTYLLPGNYHFYFNATDGLFSARFPSISNITNLTVTSVNTHSPTLQSGTHITDEGFNDTKVMFSVLYKDLDNNPPQTIRVIVDGSDNYTLQPANLTRNNYMNLVEYTASILLDGGYHDYYFTCDDGSYSARLPSTGRFTRFKVYDRTLDGSTIAWLRAHGEGSNATYTQFLTLARNLGASYSETINALNYSILSDVEILVINEGGTALSMAELDALRTWIYNGGGLIVLGDNQDAGQMSIAQYFHLGLSLSGGSTTVSSNLNFSQALSNKVASINFQSNPQNTISMIASDHDWRWFANTSDGRTVIALRRIGEGKIAWISDEIFANTYLNMADNAQLANNTLVWVNLLKNNMNPPVLGGSALSPSSGNSTTWYTFNVTYSDLDGNGPVYLCLTINGSIYAMQKVNSSAFNYNSGVVYQKRLLLQPGNYSYSFEGHDGKFSTRLPSSGNYSGPTVSLVNSFSPILVNGTVDHASGYNTTAFGFEVSYTDLDNNLPSYVRLVLNGTIYQMTAKNVSDFNAMDSLEYMFTTHLLPGQYQYHFEASDGSNTARLPSSGEMTGLTVIKAPLGGKCIGWVRSHGEITNSTYWNFLRGFADLGGNTSTILVPLTSVLLDQYDVLIVGEGGTAWPIAEMDAVRAWVLEKGILIVLGDNGDASQVSISSEFDVYYRTGSFTSGNTTLLHPYHPIVSNITRMYIPNPLRAIDIPASTRTIVPLFNTTNNGVIGASIELGAGRIFWVTDEVLTDVYINDADNDRFASNIYQLAAIDRRNDGTPVLTNLSFTPLTGTQADVFVVEIDYQDVNDAAPEWIVINLNGTPYTLYRKDQVGWNYSLGVRYKASFTLTPGNYYYSLNASNGFNSTRYPSSGLLGPIVVLYDNQHAPVLTGIAFNTRVVSANSSIIVNLTYSDEDNNAPLNFTLKASGSSFNFVRVGTSANYISGVPFTCNVTLGTGLHAWNISVNDGLFSISSTSNSTTMFKVISSTLLANKYIGWIVTHGEFNLYQYGRWLGFAEDLGATVEIISNPIDQVNLSRYIAIIIQEQGSSWTQSEISKILSWAEGGGTLLIMGDENYPSTTQISRSLNVYYSFSILPEEYTRMISGTHHVSRLSSKIYLPGPYASINLANSSTSLLSIIQNSAGKTIVAALNYSKGKIMWISDEILIDYAISEADNENFGRLIWEWITTTVTPIGNPPGTLEIIIVVIAIGGVIGIISALSYRSKHKIAKKVTKRNIRASITQPSKAPEERIQVKASNVQVPATPMAVAKFFCPSCKIYQDVPDPDMEAWYKCPSCGTALQFIKTCPHCNQPIALTKEQYNYYRNQPIECWSCKKEVKPI
nr:hypothetical protein [Candidatus Sigynarchaeota archaeon]